MKVSSFRELMAGHKEAKIYCLYTNKLVRILTVNGDQVQIDATVPPIISVSLDTAITYEPWVMDRGNMLFVSDELPGSLKICGEEDLIVYEDGTSDRVQPSAIP